jgi:HK97 gp10 family phage protein
MADIQLEGMPELVAKLNELGKKGIRVQNRAILAAAKPILDAAVANAPRKTGKGAAGLKMGRIQNIGSLKRVLVGITKGDISEIYYMKFQEFGAQAHTIRIDPRRKAAGGILKNVRDISHPGTKAHPFMGPAYEGHKAEAIRIMGQEFRKGLGI